MDRPRPANPARLTQQDMIAIERTLRAAFPGCRLERKTGKYSDVVSVLPDGSGPAIYGIGRDVGGRYHAFHADGRGIAEDTVIDTVLQAFHRAIAA